MSLPESVVIPETPDDEPDAPESLPAYVTEPLDRQSADALREIAHYALERAAWLDHDRAPADDALEVGDDEQLVETEETSSGTIVHKMIPCGSDCEGCPHGPYAYRNKREGDTVKTTYLGKVEQ